MEAMIAVDKFYGARLSNGALTFVCQTLTSVVDNQPAGILQDVAALSFQIFQSDQITSVYPRTSLNVVTDRLGVGRYAATWTPGSTPVGPYFVRWTYKIKITDSEKYFDQEFELVEKPYRSGYSHYCTISDLKEMDLVALGTLTEAQLQRKIEIASKYAETYTGRGVNAFDPIYKVLEVDGNSARELLLREPIVTIEKILLTVISAFGASNLSIISEALRIYNRHLTSKLVNPDDRNSPKLAFLHGDDLNGVNYNYYNQSGYRLDHLIWPRGQRNVQVTGIFGYTEADDSFVGHTPDMLREAVKLLVFRNLIASCTDDRQATQRGYRLTQENTRDQGAQYAQPWLRGYMTGDPEIDNLLIAFSRPPSFGAA